VKTGACGPSKTVTLMVRSPPVMLSFLIPLSMAYAVVKHRVLDVPVRPVPESR